jgi:DNA-binding NtrC family response regulator
MSEATAKLRTEEERSIRVLLVSPNTRLRTALREKLRAPRWSLIEATSGAEALEYLHEEPSEVLLVDPLLPDLESGEFSALVREQFPGIQILTVNSHTGTLILGASSPTSLAARVSEALCSGAASQARTSLPLEIQQLRSGGEEQAGIRGMVGRSPAMQQIYNLVRRVAKRDTTVLVSGESGTGKDLVAQAIHLLSARQNQPFVVINCAAIPEPLLEAELFGYVKGSFTGAVQSRIGRIHAAHGGTLFLDEIGEMPLSLQSKILRFLEQGEVQRIGGNDNLKVDVRVVAATNADLPTLVQQKLFREDLYYRLAIFPIKLPPLRERTGDVSRLVPALLAKLAPGVVISSAALEVLEGHRWPGNVRELRNVLERSCILAGDEREIQAHDILL